MVNTSIYNMLCHVANLLQTSLRHIIKNLSDKKDSISLLCIVKQLYLMLKFYDKVIITQHSILIRLIITESMGNQNCNECKENNLEGQAYGSYQILQQDNKVYAVVEKIVENSQQSQKLIKTVKGQLQMRKNIKNNHIVNLNKYRIIQQKFGFKVLMFYEYVGKSLKDRLMELTQNISQRELFSIIYGVQQGLIQLSKNNIKHCCINMQTILCKNNLYKITDISSTAYVTSYQLAIKGNKQQFLSQKLVGCIYNKSLNPNYQLKDDLFSLGMIALSIATQKSSQYFYNWNQKGQCSIMFKNLQNSLKLIQKRYSSKLVKKIKSLIYGTETQISHSSQNETNLTQNLISLDEQFNRVMGKVNKHTAQKNKSLHQTIAGTPEGCKNRSQSFIIPSQKNND